MLKDIEYAKNRNKMGEKKNNTQQESSDKKKSRVYYGEYSLEYWIELMMKRKIVLPEYQRRFVWKEYQVKAFIDSLKKGLYVPPVTLGLCEIDNAKKNIIIDGQQRLTSLMLAYFNIFPKIDKFGKFEKYSAYSNYWEDAEHLKILEWKFEKLLENEAKSKEQVMENISEEDYSKLDITIEPDFFKKTCLGFTYIVPYSTLDEKEQAQARYYSSVFRNINIQGTALSKMESRKSLYFLDDNFSGLFCPNFEQQVMINNQHIDFVRYLAFASQYSKQGNADELAKHYGGNIERYYEDFIYFFINDKERGAYDNVFANHSEVFMNDDPRIRAEILQRLYYELKLPKKFTSIIPADLHLMGLVYYVIFKEKDIDIKRNMFLKNELVIAGKEIIDDVNHRKFPSKLKYLRWRMSKSVEIYSKYVI